MTAFFKDLLATGRVIRVFCVGRLAHPVAIQMFGLAGGFDGFWLDQEHAGLSIDQITVAALAGRALGMGTFVRMPPTSYASVTQSLESGVDGVMAAQVSGVEEADRFVRFAKFAPHGMRGVNLQGADADFSQKSLAQLATDANRDHFIAIQIETAGAVDQAAEIAALDGVDLLFVGPSDLAQALGVFGERNHARVWSAIDRVADACREHGKAWGIVPPDGVYARRCVDQGCRMITVGSDVLAMRLGIESLRSEFKAFF